MDASSANAEQLTTLDMTTPIRGLNPSAVTEYKQTRPERLTLNQIGNFTAKVEVINESPPIMEETAVKIECITNQEPEVETSIAENIVKVDPAIKVKEEPLDSEVCCPDVETMETPNENGGLDVNNMLMVKMETQENNEPISTGLNENLDTVYDDSQLVKNEYVSDGTLFSGLLDNAPEKVSEKRLKSSDSDNDEPLSSRLELVSTLQQEPKKKFLKFKSYKKYKKCSHGRNTGCGCVYKCPICKKHDKYEKDFRIHLVTEHRDKFKDVCTYCGIICKDEVSLQRHVKIYHKYIANCRYCHKLFVGKTPTTLSLLMNHERVHEGTSNYECPVCFRQFENLSRVTSHTLQHLKKRNKQLNIDNLNNSENNLEEISVDECSKDSDSPQDFKCDPDDKTNIIHNADFLNISSEMTSEIPLDVDEVIVKSEVEQ